LFLEPSDHDVARRRKCRELWRRDKPAVGLGLLVGDLTRRERHIGQ
jgi:hypothetical protein